MVPGTPGVLQASPSKLTVQVAAAAAATANADAVPSSPRSGIKAPATDAKGGAEGRTDAALAGVLAERWPAPVVVCYVCETLEHCVPLVRV
eukprot:1048196-Pelagomonas_calceolata.AAC.6